MICRFIDWTDLHRCLDDLKWLQYGSTDESTDATVDESGYGAVKTGLRRLFDRSYLSHNMSELISQSFFVQADYV